MEPSSSSSKVTVEYFDPSGVFPLVSAGLFSRLPLRNLHWKSPSRPLRSINSLHVDLIPYGELQQRSQSPPGTRPGHGMAKSEESIQGIGDALARTQSLRRIASERGNSSDVGVGVYKGPIKERRHQIPGLRQTPYLKVFFLRCDDTDVYKATSRKQLREWIKEHATQSSQSTTSVSGQENHDAFEWLIVHVVLPNTTAASQPHTSGSSNNVAGSGPEKVPGTSRWPGRGTSSILDKIRSDFNGSSKSAKDRVAQIRVQKGTLENSAISSSSGEAIRDQENAWSDLISKFKSLILTSFDLRVSQYEEDVREKDAQRSLPGWNFCTFFVLKEGLARGFENVGLVEDALAGYDELAVGLDTIVGEQASHGSNKGHAGTFLTYTEDLWQQAEAALSAVGKSEAAQKEADTPEDETFTSPPLSATKKPYRDLILSNNISVFDFRCYLFARQLSLLLRLGNALSSRSGLMAKLQYHPATEGSEYSFHDDGHGRAVAQRGDDSEDLITLAEVCKRGIEFITSVSRIMRSDLWNAYHAKVGSSRETEESDDRASSDDGRGVDQIIDSLVSSWTFSLTQQILTETSTKTIPIPLISLPDTNSSSVKTSSPGGPVHEPKVAIPEPKTMMHPARTSSLAPRHSMPEPLSPGVFPSGLTPVSDPGVASPPGAMSNASKAGLEDLASYRAELYLLGRRVLEHLGREQGWYMGWSELAGIHINAGSAMEEVNLEDDGSTEGGESETEDVAPKTVDSCTIKNSLLRSALQEKNSFYNVYEVKATRTKSVESVMADLAALKFHLGDYATAATHFHHMAPFYAEGGWSLIETSMLIMYARCLKELGRSEEYVNVILKLLAKAVAREKRLVSRRGGKDTGRDLGLESENYFDGDAVAMCGYVRDLTSLSNKLSLETTVPMSKYFSDIHVEPYPRHLPDRDGFQLQLQIRHFLEDDLEIQGAKVRVVGAIGGQGREIWLESNDRFVLKRGLSRMWVGSNLVIPGSYIVDRILLECHKVIFVHETLSKASASTPTGISGSFSAAAVTAAKKSRIVYCPPSTTLRAKMRLPRLIYLDVVRSIEIEIATGWNNISRGELRLRCASAGLRLRTADTELVEGNVDVYDKSKPGMIAFGPLTADSSVVFRIPYVLESDLSDLSIKIEVAYTTEKGNFLFAANSSESIVLPLGVNVQDIFKEKAIVRRSGKPKTPSAATRNEQKPLALYIKYCCLDEEIEEALESAFASAFDGSSLGDLSQLLIPTLHSWVRRRSANELETIGLLGEINLGPFKDMRWDEVLDGLPSVSRERVERWLIRWHEKNPVILLPEPSSERQGRNREIVIPVEVPQVQVVHTAELRMLNLDSSNSSAIGTATIGQLLVAELHIKHTRVWDTGKVNALLQNSAEPRQSGADAPLEFIYEIHANPDQWLIGGRRRVQFAARENELHKFPITLLPLRPGHLLLPTVDIRPFVLQPNPDNEEALIDQTRTAAQPSPAVSLSASGQRLGPIAAAGNALSHQGSPQSPGETETPTITCETDCRNQGEAILVLPNVKSTTVSLDPAHGGGAFLVESEKRIDSVMG
ncbi:hypothetical protein FGG08_005021 [Glutinoglossum americanum]|uniref:TMEM1 family protein n=1 Tax=Glutinoglossum americanum TaxID=1670608 RepID=A0A9P8I3U7_9PEZI|nr:hypothetical protein FGG08_005021 [Glutinoglossum americanum]